MNFKIDAILIIVLLVLMFVLGYFVGYFFGYVNAANPRSAPAVQLPKKCSALAVQKVKNDLNDSKHIQTA